jgi:hypothetical protein
MKGSSRQATTIILADYQSNNMLDRVTNWYGRLLDWIFRQIETRSLRNSAH